MWPGWLQTLHMGLPCSSHWKAGGRWEAGGHLLWLLEKVSYSRWWVYLQGNNCCLISSTKLWLSMDNCSCISWWISALNFSFQSFLSPKLWCVHVGAFTQEVQACSSPMCSPSRAQASLQASEKVNCGSRRTNRCSSCWTTWAFRPRISWSRAVFSSWAALWFLLPPPAEQFSQTKYEWPYTLLFLLSALEKLEL